MKLCIACPIIALLFFFFQQSSAQLHQISITDPVSPKTFFTQNAGKIPLVSAHRGGPYPGFAENCIPTFAHVLSKTWAILEFDVELTKDSVMVLMHDRTLNRTTNGSGAISDKNYAEMKALRLKDNDGKLTNDTIPTLDQTLQWLKGKTIATVDVKKNVPFEGVIDAIRRNGVASHCVVITYSIQDMLKVHQLAPEIMISATIRSLDEFERVKATGVDLTRLIAFTGVSEAPPALLTALHAAGIPNIIGTMGNLDNRAKARGDGLYQELFTRGFHVFATDRPLEAAAIFYTPTVKENLLKSKDFFFILP
jgi:glycerophosphoryl diester phosphodiesterase